MKSLAQLLRRVGTSVRAGIDARSLWAREANHGSAAHRQCVGRISEAINTGDTLASALADCGDFFPPLVVTLIDVGERTGRLDDVLHGLAEHYEHLLALRKTFLIGIAWPALQLLAAIGVVGLLIWILGVIPSGAGGQATDILGFGLIGTSGMLTYFGLVGVVAAGTTVFVMALMRGALGPGPMQLAMRLPVIGNCLKTSALSRLAWTLSLSLDSGLDARRAMQLALRSTENAYYTSHLEDVDAAIVRGNEFHEALRATGIFPDDFVHALEVAEVSGTHGESLQRLAIDYRERTKSAARALTIAATTAVWIFVAGVLIFLIFRLALSYIGMIYDALEPL
jgi:type II secretory pathway component PulF